MISSSAACTRRCWTEACADQGIDLAEAIHSAIAADSLPGLIAAASPQLAQYRNLQRLLLRYRELAADTGPAFGQANQLGDAPGKPYPDLWSSRRRLVAMGDLEPVWAADLSGVYTSHDAAAVRRFQVRHALPATGLLDSATVAAVNVPFGWRVRQIELALERLRWLPPIGRQRFLVVNVPAFQLFAFDSVGGTGNPALSMRVIVGNALDTRTPVLFERLRYLEFRPYWYIPHEHHNQGNSAAAQKGSGVPGAERNGYPGTGWQDRGQQPHS